MRTVIMLFLATSTIFFTSCENQTTPNLELTQAEQILGRWKVTDYYSETNSEAHSDEDGLHHSRHAIATFTPSSTVEWEFLSDIIITSGTQENDLNSSQQLVVSCKHHSRHS